MGAVQESSPNPNLKMKFLVLLAAIGCASAASSNAVTCDECQAGAAALVDHLLSDASLAEQGAILKGVVCSRLGLCKKAAIFTPRDWTCEECTDVLARTAAYMADEATIAEGVIYLQGD